MTSLNATRPDSQPVQSLLDGEKQNQRPPNSAQQDVKSRKARCVGPSRGVNESDGESEENPSDDIVSDTGGEDNDSDGCVEKLAFGEDSAEDWEGGADTGEEEWIS